jgi:hypothetical protein
MRGWKSAAAIAAAAGMLIYALPRLEIERLRSLPGIFAVVWTGFILLIVAANLHDWLGVDDAQKERLNQIKRLRKRQLHQVLTGGGPLRANNRSRQSAGDRTAFH